MKKMRNSITILLYTIIIGAVVGTIIWGFLRLMNSSIYFLWEYIPEKFNIPFYPIFICLTIGLLTGIWKEKYGESPEELEVVMAKVKKDGRWEYDNIKSSMVSALLPLIGGASIGPESGLTGIIAGLCTWAGDKLKGFYGDVRELTRIGITASLGTIFSSPLFDFSSTLEDDDMVSIPKKTKTVLYFAAIISSFGIFIFLNKIFGGSTFESMELINKDINILYIVFLSFIGILLGLLYFGSKKICDRIMSPIKNKLIVKGAIGGLVLGICGCLLPLTMFSGEEQIITVLDEGGNIGFVILVLTGVVKIILTNICIFSGLKGGHFFPMIFSGICLGYAFSLIMDIDSTLAMAVVTTATVSHVLKKPLATVLLLMIVFPVSLIPIMIGVSAISVFIKTPKFLYR